MIAFLIIIAIFIIKDSRLRKNRENNDFLEKETTSAIIGVFVPVVFLSHINIDYSPWYDHVLNSFCHTILSQLMTVPFLFYSGYGIARQYLKRGDNYILNFPIQRIGKVYSKYLLCYFVEVLYYACKTGFKGTEFDWIKLTVWNGSWFIFVILCEYLAVWSLCLIFKQKKKWIACGITAFSVLLSAVLMISGKETWWYNTTIAFAFGIIIGLYKNEAVKFISQNYVKTLILNTLLFLASFALLYLGSGTIEQHFVIYITLYFIKVLSFMNLILLLTYLFSFKSKVFTAISKYVIYAHLLQYFVFDFYKDVINVIDVNKYLYVVCCLVTTALLSVAVGKIASLFDTKVIDKLVINERYK